MSESLVDMSCPIGIPGNIVNRKPFGRVPHSFASLKWEDENSMHLALSGSGCNEPQRCIIDRILLFMTVYVGRLADTPRNSESRKLAIGVLSDIIPDVRMGISPEGLPNSFGCIILFRRQSVSSLWFCKQWGRLRLRDCLAHRFDLFFRFARATRCTSTGFIALQRCTRPAPGKDRPGAGACLQYILSWRKQLIEIARAAPGA